ncbi:MAG TPA: phenylalanine--tRNA ligase subunit beta [Thermoanaerobaculia bacterium]|nr:phenylalanine--tRNA ligase subunit beta [Thermoanaerobaculia bacterium]
MKLSLDWLRDYVELPDDPRELGRRLTQAGLAVEGIEEGENGTVLDVDVTTNRPDCMNHLGMAREAAVLYGKPLRRPPAAPAESSEPVENAASVTIDDPVGCPRYAARVIRGVRIGPSPEWLRRRLEAIGVRSISNVVDVTNFVLWELGQPIHAFDLAKLEEGRIVVRRARPGEALVTLDGQPRELSPEMLVIADAARPVALAGVMGGADSEVNGETRDILIESAHFDRKSVRRTARGLGMHTDASHRFERGADPEICAEAASRAATLIAELAGGEVLAGTIDARAAEVPVRRGRLELAKLNAFAGVEVAAADVERWLVGLGFRLESRGEGAWEVAVPSWRLYDFEPRPEPPHEIYPADLYEEVLRILGFDAIPTTLPALPGSDGPQSGSQRRRTLVRRHLAAAGYAEAVHFAFQDPAADAAFPSLRPEARPLRLANPLSERYAVLRRSLVPNLVESARFNQRRGAAAVRLFEVATVFYESPHARDNELPDQPEHVGLVCGGRLGSPWEREVDLDLFDLKGAVESLAEALGVRLEARPAALPGLLPGSAAELLRDGGAVAGFFGQVAEQEGYPLYVAEVALDALAAQRDLEVELPSRVPGIAADLTFTHPLATPWAEIRQAIEELKPAELVSFGLEARYRGPGVPAGAVNTTVHFLYNAQDRSLTQDEVNAWQEDLAGKLRERFGWRG